MSWLVNIFKKFIKFFKYKKEEKKQEDKAQIATSSSTDAAATTASEQNIAHIVENYQNAVNQLEKQAQKAINDIEKAKADFEGINKEIRETRQIVVVGFWVIIVMLISVFIGYWINAINKADLIEKINNSQSFEKFYQYSVEINNLKSDLENLRIRNPYLK